MNITKRKNEDFSAGLLFNTIEIHTSKVHVKPIIAFFAQHIKWLSLSTVYTMSRKCNKNTIKGNFIQNIMKNNNKTHINNNNNTNYCWFSTKLIASMSKLIMRNIRFSLFSIMSVQNMIMEWQKYLYSTLKIIHD